MKNLKKVLALVVALTMVFTTVAFASYPDVDANADYASAVELLSALEILKGDDNGNFNPDNTITRAEYAAVVCRALGWEASANGAKGATMFTDVAADHWASGYINLASQQGIVNGKGNGIFDPEGNVTFTEAVKMLVVAIGYEPMAAQKGGWPTGYLTVANSIKMTAGVAATGTDAAALRSTVAQLTANAIEIPVMDQVSYGTLTEYIALDDYNNYKTLLTAADVHKVTGVVSDVDEVNGEFTFKFSEYPEDFEFGYSTNGVAINNFVGKTADFDVAASNVADFIGQSVDVYLKKVNRSDYEALLAVASGIGDTLMISVEDFAGATTFSATAQSVIEYYETKDANRATKIYVEKNPIVKVNGKVVNDGASTVAITDLDAYKTKVATVTFTENTNDKYFDIIDITMYQYGIVDEVFVEKNRIEFLDTKVSFDPEDDEQIVAIYNAEGAEIALADIAEGDVLAMVVGEINASYLAKPAVSFKEKITIYNLGQSSVTGTVTGLSETDKELVIDGTTYEYMAGNWVADKVATFIPDALGAEGVFYLGLDGKIIGFDGSSVVSGNYGFIAQGTLLTSGFAPHYQIKMLTADAGVVVFDVADDAEIDGTEAKVTIVNNADTSAQTKLAFAEYNNANDAANAYKRIVKYDTNKNGEIDEIKFVAKDQSFDDKKYAVNSSSNKIGSYKVDENVVVFDLDKSDVEDAKAIDMSALIEEVEYSGFAYDLGSDKNVYDLVVLTSAGAAFAGDVNLMVANSVVKTTYDEDDAYLVKYYVGGEATEYDAIFTDESTKIGTGDYTTLTKGSVFVANVAEDGFVTDYSVLATMVNDTFVTTNLQTNAKLAFKQDYAKAAEEDFEIFVGYIKNYEKADVTVAGRTFDVTNSAAQYAFNTTGSKDKIEVGMWDIENIGKYEDGKANLVLIKCFDNDVTDIITIDKRVAVAANAIDTALSAPTYAQQGGNLSSVEVEVEVEVEDVVEVEEIVFE